MDLGRRNYASRCSWTIWIWKLVFTFFHHNPGSSFSPLIKQLRSNCFRPASLSVELSASLNLACNIWSKNVYKVQKSYLICIFMWSGAFRWLAMLYDPARAMSFTNTSCSFCVASISRLIPLDNFICLSVTLAHVGILK